MMCYKEENSVHFSHIGRQWHIYRADMETLWANMENDQEALQAFYDDERLPYWAELWGSSFGLATWLWLKRDILKGRSCMDLGCGLGFTALCGVHCGAKVLACDYEENALNLARFNALKNAVPICDDIQEFKEINSASLCTLKLDWRNPCIEGKVFSFIWAADIAYEKKSMPEILAFLDYALTDEGVFWIAEPGRSIYQHFLTEANNFSFFVEKVHAETSPKISEHILPAGVNVWELRRK